MTEREWLECAAPGLMLAALPRPLSHRKVTLYLCAGARSLWGLLYDHRSREGVEVLEREADGEASAKEVFHARYSAESPSFGYHFNRDCVREDRWSRSERASIERLLAMGVYTEEDLARGADPFCDEGKRLQLVGMAHIVYHAFHAISDGEMNSYLLRLISDLDPWPGGELVREVFGSPFRPAILSPEWLTPTVLSLAAPAYPERELPGGALDNPRLAVLADALEEAGAGGEVLDHLRSAGPHVRGCWALDAVLGRR